MSYTPGLSEGDAVAGVEPPLEGSGGTGWLSAIFLEMVEIRRLLEAMLILHQESKEDEEDDES